MMMSLMRNNIAVPLVCKKGGNTVEPLIMDTLKSGQPPYNGHTVHPLPIYCLPRKTGQPLNNGQNTRPQCVHYSEVPPVMDCVCSKQWKRMASMLFTIVGDQM